MAQKTKKLKKTQLRQFIEYMISGGAYFWSGYLVFFFIDKGLGMAFFWAKSISTLAGWTVNYVLQRYWVFKNPELAQHKTQVTTRYTFITILNFVLDYLIVFGLKLIGVTPYIGQFVSAGFFTIWNYLWYKYWVFPDKFSTGSKKVKQTPVRVVAHHAHSHAAYRVAK